MHYHSSSSYSCQQGRSQTRRVLGSSPLHWGHFALMRHNITNFPINCQKIPSSRLGHLTPLNAPSSAPACQGSNGFVPSQPSASSYGDMSALLLLPATAAAAASFPPCGEHWRPWGAVSTGDLGAPVPTLAVRYNTEERRERIEKYKSKRNQRNFQKKITYACRKTLADSRPRVKGRFARNVDDVADQPEFTVAEVTSMANETNVVVVDATDASSNRSMPEWWPAMQGALAMEEDELYFAVSSINLY